MAAWEDYKKTMRTENPIFASARSGDLDALKFILNNENINLEDSKGYSPLMLAAYNGQEDVVKYLIAAGADINQTDYSSNSILMGAAFKGHLKIVKLLVAAGVDIEAQNTSGQSALQFAEMFGRSEVVLFLKSKLNKPEVFGLKDILSGWVTYFSSKRRSS